MDEHDRAARRRSWRRVVVWAMAAVAATSGSVQLAKQWKEMLLGPELPANLEQAPGSAAEINREATLSTVQTITGNVAQDNSRNVTLYQNAFRVEVVRGTDAAPAANRRLRDDVLTVLDDLIGVSGGSAVTLEQAQELGQRLGAILETAPISSYRLQEQEFTLRQGTAWFLPGGDDSFALVGPARDGSPEAITIRRNGRESNTSGMGR